MNLAVIFDLDGTLIDTPRGIVETFSATLESMNISVADHSTIKETIGLPLQKAFSHLLQIDVNDKRVAHAITQYQTLFKEIVLPKAKQLIFPGVTEGLTKLKNKGCKLAVATSKFYASAEALLKAADLWKHFDLVVGADQVTHPKPHPEMGHLVLSKLPAEARTSIMVGDTTHDIFMANEAGIRSIAVTYGVHDIKKLQSAKPTYIADTFNSVVNLVATL